MTGPSFPASGSSSQRPSGQRSSLQRSSSFGSSSGGSGAPGGGSGRSAAKAARPAFHCTECGASVPKWAGRCPNCQAWGWLAEVGAGQTMLRKVTPGPVTAAARPIAEIDASQVAAQPSGVAELDRVLGGGLVPGGVVLLAGGAGGGE